MTPTVVLVTGVSRFLGGHLAARLAANPRHRTGPRRGHRPAAAGSPAPDGPGRVRARRHPQPAHLQGHLAGLGRHRRPRLALGQPRLVRRPYGDEGDERHRHDAAARGVPEGPDGAPHGAEVHHRRVRVQPARPGPVRRVDDARRTSRPAATRRTPPRSRATCAGFARRRPDVSVTVLRFANFIGPRIDTVFTRYFALPVVPTVLGYDARVQLLHEEDALAVLERATTEELPGVFNVAADGVLLLSQAIRRAGRVAGPGARAPPSGRRAACSAAPGWSTSPRSRCGC